MTGTIGQRFEQLISGLTRQVDFEQWPDSIFFFGGEDCLFVYSPSDCIFWFDRQKVWNYLEAHIFSANAAFLQAYVKRKMKRYLNIGGNCDNYIFPLALSKHWSPKFKPQ